jgi:dGTPase
VAFLLGETILSLLYGSADTERILKETEELKNGRSAFRRDYGRLLHSPSFRRLQGKTQLFPGHESDFFRNRLTHSLEVAQVAKGIAQRINATNRKFRGNEVDLDLIEFAGLAHDLGHPPFGHNGERALDYCMAANGGFEGNAQTLRILAKVEKKVLRPARAVNDICGVDPNGVDRRLGLNLTYRSLAAVLKYDEMIPLQRQPGDKLKKGYYASEQQLVTAIKQHVGSPASGGAFKTIECQIMDIADDIAYSTYDLEDAMKGGFTHPMQLLSKIGEERFFKQLYSKVSGAVQGLTESEMFNALTDLLTLSYGGTALEQYAESKLLATDGKMRSEFSSELVGGFINGVSVKVPRSGDLRFSKVEVARETLIKIESLKHLSYLLTIMSPRLKVVEHRGFDVVKTIFETLNKADGHTLLPDDLQTPYSRLRDTDSKRRLICDFIAGMTDRYALEFYGRLMESGATIFKPI